MKVSNSTSNTTLANSFLLINFTRLILSKTNLDDGIRPLHKFVFCKLDVYITKGQKNMHSTIFAYILANKNVS